MIEMLTHYDVYHLRRDIQSIINSHNQLYTYTIAARQNHINANECTIYLYGKLDDTHFSCCELMHADVPEDDAGSIVRTLQSIVNECIENRE
jgi:hypothetical protein